MSRQHAATGCRGAVEKNYPMSHNSEDLTIKQAPRGSNRRSSYLPIPFDFEAVQTPALNAVVLAQPGGFFCRLRRQIAGLRAGAWGGVTPRPTKRCLTRRAILKGASRPRDRLDARSKVYQTNPISAQPTGNHKPLWTKLSPQLVVSSAETCTDRIHGSCSHLGLTGRPPHLRCAH